MHVLIGTTSCWLKFSQDADLRRFLLSTRKALLVETAPNDGSWGVAMNSSQFLQGAAPQDFALFSAANEELRFDVGLLTITRHRCEANALGKSLMITRALLEAGGKEAAPNAAPALVDVIALVARQMKLMQVPFDYGAAVEHLRLCHI